MTWFLRYIPPVCLVLAIALAAGRAAPCRAQDTAAVASDRPGFGDGSAVVPPGRFQVEAGYAYAGTEDGYQHALGQVVLRLGLIERVELRALLNSYLVAHTDCPPDCTAPGGVDRDGFEDVAVGAKVNLLPGDGRPLGVPAVTALFTVALPTGGRDVTNDHLRPEGKLALDLALTDAVAFSANAGYAFDLGGEPETVFFTYAAFGAAFPGVEGLGVFAGLYSLFHGTDLLLKELSTSNGLDGGFTYLPDPATQLDLNFGVGLSGGEPDFTIGAGVARRF